MWPFRHRPDDDFHREIEAHVAIETGRLISEGLSPEDARHAAARAFGNVTKAQEQFYESRRILWLDELQQDVRYAWRVLRKSPAFTAAAVLTLALGLGANTTMFAIANATLIRPLPYPRADRLVWVEQLRADGGARVPATHVLDWRAHSRATDGIAAYTDAAWTLTGVDSPERLEGHRVSAGFFSTLGTDMLLGRSFLPVEDRAGGEAVAILGHALWQRQFRGDRGILGRSIRLDNDSYRVVGVLPADFRFLASGEIWVPLALDEAQEHGTAPRTFGYSTLSVIARLRPGIDVDGGAAELQRVIRILGRPETGVYKEFATAQLRLTPLHRHLVGDTRRLILVLMAAVVLILLVACANIASLLVARSIAREKELAVRIALGAKRGRLVRQVLTEGALIAYIGGILGLLVASPVTQALVSWSSYGTFGPVARLATFSQDRNVLAFALCSSVLCAASFGLLAGLHVARAPFDRVLSRTGRDDAGRPGANAREWLMACEISAAVVLLVGTALFLRSFVNLLDVDPGYRTENVLTARVSLPLLRYQDRPRRTQTQRELLERIGGLPDVDVVGSASVLPLTSAGFGIWLSGSGPVRVELGAGPPAIPLIQVSPEYFRAMRIPLRSGRAFDDRDRADASPAIIVSESIAARLFPGGDAVGRQVWTSTPFRTAATVVGVVGDVRHQGLDTDVRPQVYIPYQQFPSTSFFIAARTTADPQAMTSALRAAVAAVDPEIPLYDIQPADRRIAESIASPRFVVILVASFALIGVTLSLVGIYGVVSYVVGQRTREIGIRVALGARPRAVVRDVLRQTAMMTAAGLAAGVVAAAMLSRYLEGMLVGVSPGDVPTFAIVVVLFTSAAALASYVPAHRAATVSPLAALRTE